MRCSQRALDLEASATLALAARVKALRAEGKTFLASQPASLIFRRPRGRRRVQQAIEDGKHGYEPVPGTPEGSRSHRDLSSKGWCGLHSDDIVLTAGGKMALSLCCSAARTRSW